MSLFGRSMGGLFQAVLLVSGSQISSFGTTVFCGKDPFQNLPFLIPHIICTQLSLPILGGVEMASSDALHTTPPLLKLPSPCWTWHFAPT